MKHNRAVILYAALLAVVSVTAAGCNSDTQTVDTAESAFLAQIETAESGEEVLYASFSSIDEMVETTHANRIIRCTVTERGDCTVFDPMGVLSEAERDSKKAAQFLATPYTLTVSDSYLGNLTKGETVTFYAQYGILGGTSYRQSRYPILETGAEYIMFLRAEEIGGEIVYYLTYTPDSVVRVSGTETIPDTSLFSAYAGDIPALESEIRSLVAENNYSTEIQSSGTADK